MRPISGVYKITNKITGDFYIGSSNDVKRRWAQHKSPSQWLDQPNSRLYNDMQKYGIENFRFQILVKVIPEFLKQKEQEFIEMLKPTYNNYRAKDPDIERYKKSAKKRHQSEKYKKYQEKYRHQTCIYNGETLKLGALAARFQRWGIHNPTLEAKKYLTK